MRRAVSVLIAVAMGVILLGGAILIPRAAALGLSWDPATLRQPNELKHRVRAVLSSLSVRPAATDDMVPIAYTDLPPLGINTFLDLEVEEAKVRRSLEMARAAGFRSIRQQFAWYEIETPAKGQYVDGATGGSSWAKYDRIVRLAGEYGLTVLARMDTVPAWARPQGSTFTHPPTNLQDYADFAATLAARYRGKVRYYQVWNEPNLAFEWGDQDVKASDFVPLLKAGYTAIKQADPAAVVICAALAPTIDRGPHNRNDVLFLQEMYDAGAKGYFDVMSTMAYGLLSGPDDRRRDPFWQVNFSRSLLLREIMVRQGDSGKPIWFSELAWNALPGSFGDNPTYGRVTPDQQARYTVRGLQRVQEEWPWAGVSFVWFLRRPTDAEKDQQFYYFRLLEPDFTPLPVYDAIARAAPSFQILPRGYHSPQNWAVTATGNWQTGGRGERASQTAGDRLSFTVDGTDLRLVAQGPGRMYVDAPGTRLPIDGQSRAYVDLPAEKTETVVLHGLPAGLHAVTLTVGEGQATVLGLVVDKGAPFPALLLAAGALYALLWAIVWRVQR